MMANLEPRSKPKVQAPRTIPTASQPQRDKEILVDVGLLLLTLGEWQMVESLTRLVQLRGLSDV